MWRRRAHLWPSRPLVKCQSSATSLPQPRRIFSKEPLAERPGIAGPFESRSTSFSPNCFGGMEVYMFRRTTGVLLAIVLGLAPAASAQPRPITLEEAVGLAKRNALQVIQARGQARTSAAGVRAAYAAFLPNVTLTASATRWFVSGGRTRGANDTLPSDPWSSDAGFGANVDIFTGGQRFFALRQARATQWAAEVNETAQQYDAALAAKQEFFNVLAARESQGAAAAQLAQAAQRGAWTDYLPSLAASYSRTGSGTGDAPVLAGDNFGYSGALRFSASLPLFNQWQREERITQARVAQENAEAGLRDTRLAAVETLTQQLGAFRSAEERVVSQAASVAAAEEDLRVQQQRYAVGGSTILDVLTSQTQLNEARSDLLRARYDQRAAKAQLEALVGREL